MLAGSPAQHGVDEPAIGRKPPSLCEGDGARHRRMGGRFEEGQLGDPEPQHVLYRPPPRRQRSVQKPGQEGVDLAKAAQRRQQQ